MSSQKIAVVTDSSAYIPPSALEGLNVSVIPLWLIWDGDRFRDGIDIDPPTFYERLRQSKTLPTSSQPSPGEFVDFFRQVAEQADIIVGVLVSAKISGTIASARTAQGQLPGLTIRLVDARSSSMGLGLVVLAAARIAAAGGSLQDVVRAAEDMRDRSHFLFGVDTLEYLHRGGRIGSVKRVMGTVLNIKPILQFREGQIESLSQARTKRKAIAQMLDIAEERLGGKGMAEAAIVDIDAPDAGDAVANQIKERFAPPIVHRSAVSPVVGTHVGPGAIGLAFCAEP
jgi:DegV family protein with EDD domain